MMATREEWDQRHMAIALVAAAASKDPSTKVGAHIVDGNERTISIGKNGFPRGIEDDPMRLGDRATRLKMTLHAEENAILFARRDLSGCTIYSTFTFCAHCAVWIIQAGITRAMTFEPPEDFAKRWKEDIELAESLFSEA